MKIKSPYYAILMITLSFNACSTSDVEYADRGTSKNGAANSTGNKPNKPTTTSTTPTSNKPTTTIPSTNTPTTPVPTNPQVVVPSTADCYKASAFICKIEVLIAAKTSKYRAAKGTAALKHDAKFAFIARDWSAKQAAANNISHSGFPSSREAVYQKEFGTSAEFFGENVAMTGGVDAEGETDAAAEAIAEEFASMWYGSYGHRMNMLDSSFTVIGVGVSQTSDGSWYATQIFQ